MAKTKTKIATIGAATQDVFLLGSALKAKRDVRTHTFVEQFPLGAKLEIDRVVFSTGGGATNAAATFARHGFHTQFLGKIADDPAGEHVAKMLRAEGVKTDLLQCETHGAATGYSTLLLAPRGERTVLVYRGVAENIHAADFNYFAKLQADWVYVSSLGGNFPLLESLVKYAGEHNMRLAINPGSGELKQPRRLLDVLPSFAVLSVNKEEARQLFNGKTARQLVKEAAKTSALALVTDGPKGSYACDGAYVYKAGMYKDVAVTDRTGAGDAMTSGFIAKIAAGESVENALTFGSANSTSVVQKVGAKEGILTNNSRLHSMSITKTHVTKE